MSAVRTDVDAPRSVVKPWRGYIWTAVVGVVVVPLALGLAFNSYAAPDDAAFVRMAFAQVAGSTIAIVTMLALVALSLIRRTRAATPVLIVAALLVIQYSVVVLSMASDLLLQRIG
ncbi:hypothetical protein [Agromyces allii]|uniref:Uncharacterized protein n=1 Tax=Agromyces allii TaxID=393607 RepID=A0ABP5BCU9_9MICO|nr:hypothetical protein [Agromyces allii]